MIETLPVDRSLVIIRTLAVPAMLVLAACSPSGLDQIPSLRGATSPQLAVPIATPAASRSSSDGLRSRTTQTPPPAPPSDPASAIALSIAAELGSLKVHALPGTPAAYMIGNHMLADVESAATAAEMAGAAPEAQIACKNYVFNVDPEASERVRQRANRAFLRSAHCG